MLMQGHSIVSSLPPLRENDPTKETVAQELEVKGVDTSPVPSATTSRDEEVTETTKDQPAVAAVDEKRTRKRIRLVPSASSSPTKDADLRDDGDSGSPHRAHAAPLRVCPVSSMTPPPAAGGVRFDGPGDFPSLSNEEDMFDWNAIYLCLFFVTCVYDIIFVFAFAMSR